MVVAAPVRRNAASELVIPAARKMAAVFLEGAGLTPAGTARRRCAGQKQASGINRIQINSGQHFQPV